MQYTAAKVSDTVREETFENSPLFHPGHPHQRRIDHELPSIPSRRRCVARCVSLSLSLARIVLKLSGKKSILEDWERTSYHPPRNLHSNLEPRQRPAVVLSNSSSSARLPCMINYHMLACPRATTPF